MFSVISCTESETEKSIREMVFNQNNVGTSKNLPTKSILEFNPTNIDFGIVKNSTSSSKIITIKNTFNSPINISVTHINLVTQITFTELNFTIPANGTYLFTVVFSPTATMLLNDTLRFSYAANSSNSFGVINQTLNLSGNSAESLPATLTATPTGILDFGNVIIGQTSTKTITLTNIGATSAIWTADGNVFSFMPNSGTITAGNSQQVTLAFTPTTVGIVGGTQIFSYNGGIVQIPYTINRIASTSIIALSCTTSTTFADVPLNTILTKTIKITNSGNSNLIISSISDCPEFICSYSGVIVPNTSVNIPISFKPLFVGIRICTIVVQSNKTSGSETLNFGGRGI